MSRGREERLPVELRAALEKIQLVALVRRFRRLRSSLEERRRARRAVRRWKLEGCLAPPPDSVKRKLVRAAATDHRLQVFVETGTFRGEMVEAMRRRCRTVISIELDRVRYERAVSRFAGCHNVTLVHGDSGEVLPAVLERLHEPALFWLDGHYSGPGTGRGEIDTPILAELTHVLGHDVPGHTILVDDARLFDGTNDYPALGDVERHVLSLRPGSSLTVRNDMIVVLPAP